MNDNEIKKIYYTSQEVCKEIGVSLPTLRNLVEELGIRTKRDKLGRLKFTDDHVLLLRNVVHVYQMSRIELVKKVIVTDFPRTALTMLSL